MKQTFEKYDHNEDRLYIQHVEDVEPLLDENKEVKNSGTNGYSESRLWRKIGSIPLIVAEKILREHGVNILDGSAESRKYIREFLQKNPAFMTVDKL